MSDEPRILDLNAVIPPDIFVEVGTDEEGNPRRYPFPGDAPMEDLLRLMVKANELDTATGKTPQELLAMREEVTVDVDELFRLRNPDLEDDELPTLSDAQVGELLVGLMRIYSEALSDAAGEEGGARPTSTPPKPRSAKRSPASSGRRRKRKAASGSSASSPT